MPARTAADTLYKVGDIVFVRDDLIVNRNYGMAGERNPSCMFIDRMYEFRGKQAKIAEITKSGAGKPRYRITIDGRKWSWVDDMLIGCDCVMPDFTPDVADEILFS